ncbi:MAG: glycogen debranching protein GlgX [Deltaproteobacteria bacterium]|nr:glycogen debranching protein GlgX [Deltaproteobacteria bacterium]
MLRHWTEKRISKGRHTPLGATPGDGGVNFALYSRHATEVFLVLFDPSGQRVTDVARLENRRQFVWHAFVHGVGAGQLYAYRVRGPYDPARGHRFNENKLLVDPYAKALFGKASNPENLLLGYDAGSPSDRDLSFDGRDSAAVVPRSVVVDDAFDWQGVEPPDVPIEKLIVYEVHLKGFTAHPSSGVRHPGTYLGFIEKIPYLKQLGVNAVELLPVHEIHVEDFLRGKGLTNYWGYSTLGFFAPESSYSTGRSPGCQVAEMKTLVRELHRARIDVILDVVYNHTAEGNELGPTLCFKGIDNRTYYDLTGSPEQPARYYMNTTGCGNALDLSETHCMRFVMDSLRYWAEVMRVDGFRFDLASVLGRESGGFRKSAAFFDAVSQDPVLQRVKLIAEPWDLGTYEVGNFPVDWAEWNGRFRDTVRRFVKGDGGRVPDLAARLTGSADLYGDDGRSAYSSVNFVTCHYGFTLWDLVTYDHKHNEANLEGNRDGSDDNLSWNCGAEGETDDPAVTRLRRQLVKNHFSSLIFAAGTPMILGGDEVLRTQHGNNNGYCQDNELGWFDWTLVDRNRDIVEFVKKAIALTRRYPILQRRKFFSGKDLDGDDVADMTWYGPDLAPPDWGNPDLRTLAYRLDGGEEESSAGKYHLFLILNADPLLRSVRVPAPPDPMRWRRIVDTSLPPGEDFLDPGDEILLDPAEHYLANPRSTVVLLARK